MTYIKKTNIIEERKSEGTIKRVRCPYCKTFLVPVSSYVTAMICWKCRKEFRIEQDEDKWENPYSDPMHTVVRSALV